jgi:hypothetical protein
MSQLKPFCTDYTLVYESLPVITDLEAVDIVSEAIVDRCLVKKGNTAIPQVKLPWVGLPSTATTCEDYNNIKQHFPTALAWGQAGSQGEGGVTPSDGDTTGEKN